MTQVPQIPVLTVNLCFCGNDRYLPVLSVIDSILAGFYISLPPGSDDFQSRIQCFKSQLKSHLVVPFSGTTMSDGICVFPLGDFYLPPGDEGTSKGRSKQVLFFIYGSGPEHGKCEFLYKLIS